jgi:hypothetical protein
MIKSRIAPKPFVHGFKEKKPKHCSECGKLAASEAYFDVGDSVTMIEKYCDICSKKLGFRI